MFQRDRLAFDCLLLDSQLAGNHHVSPAPVQLDDLDGDVLASKRFEVADRPGIDLGSRHKTLDPHVHRKAALHPAQNPARNDELLLVGLLQVLPNAKARGLVVREEDVALHFLAMIDHDIDHISRLDLDFAARGAELFDGNQTFGLVSEVDNDFLCGDFQYPAF